MRVGYDADSGTLVIDSAGVFPPRTLAAALDGMDQIHIRSIADRTELCCRWWEITTLAGQGFASGQAVLAYLQDEFCRHVGPGAPSWIAARPLSAPRAVRGLGDARLDYASALDPDHRAAVLGITVTAADTGTAVDLVLAGPLTSVGWGLTAGLPIFLGADGQVVQTAPPGAAFLLRLGHAAEPDTAVIRIAPAITLL